MCNHTACVQDHPACLTAFQLKPEMGDISQLDEMLGRKGQVRPKAILNYLLRRKGPLTSTGCDHGAFLSTRGACACCRAQLTLPSLTTR